MPNPSTRTPSYRLHKASGQAVVTLDGRDIYLGVHNSQSSRTEYDRVIAEWLANGRRLATTNPITIAEIVVAYLQYVDGRYRSREPANIRSAIKPVRTAYGDVQATDFGPLALKAVRKGMVDAGLCRNLVNHRIQAVVRMFKWAASEQMIPSSTWEALRTVEGLRRGAADVRESEPVRPVDDAHVVATLPFVTRQIAAMIELQRLTGARPGEVCTMRGCDLVMVGNVWEYRPADHKTAHHGRKRTIHIGRRAQEVLRPFLRSDASEYLFQPREADQERRAALRTSRKSKVQPSQVDRSKPEPKRKPGEKYNRTSYRQAIARGVAKANEVRREKDPKADLIPGWHPHQLRHSAATALRRDFGLDVARAVLGHSSAAVTEIYAEMDQAKAREAMERVG
ncbi:tyrosine-type recombinase/integrase [Paludisphaera rhizosphaerae]|uniref:tyrosine-type recombinase/integrase n=1 Tax=Paludisphaera rhizosphaerae TaxID=2711216 RepID=UPI0013EB8F00|nr:site-specific integrase [Paludisphaera rhizosphaerae]